MKGKKGKIPQPGDKEGKFAHNPTPTDVYAGEDSSVVKEAKDRSGKYKKGGRVDEMKKDRSCHASGGAAVSRGDRAPRKRGGRAMGGPMSEASKLSNRDGSRGMEGSKD
jgi:hypothetical protein